MVGNTKQYQCIAIFSVSGEVIVYFVSSLV